MRVGLFGGSFDPIHLGHVGAVRDAKVQVSLDRILFLPTAAPPHKPRRKLAPALSRFAMVELALLEEEACFVSGYELTLGRSAYTIETVRHFRDQQPENDFFLIMGMDSLVAFHTWREWQEIAEMVEIIVLARPGWGLEDLPPEAPRELRHVIASDRVHRVENQLVDASSTQLRRRLAKGEAPGRYVSDLVHRYISKYALYR